MEAPLRERIVFSNHNLMSDGIFGEMHLVFCRNVLIYFNRELQERVLTLLTDSLVPVSYTHLDVYKRQVVDLPSFPPARE